MRAFGLEMMLSVWVRVRPAEQNAVEAAFGSGAVGKENETNKQRAVGLCRDVLSRSFLLKPKIAPSDIGARGVASQQD